MMKSFAPCVLAFSAGAYASVRSVVPPVYMKFQPTPTRTSATRKCATVSPASATATQPAISATPATMIVSTPKRLIRSPVTNPGAYMPTTCHWITIAACAYGCEQKLIASGVATISRFMRP